jgi:hypothetical protein
MRWLLHQARRHAPAAVAVVMVLGFALESDAYGQSRRGRMIIPAKPAVINSTPMIDGLNRVLTALDATEHSFDGHRETAIKHINNAIRDMQVPNTKGQTKPAADVPAGITPETKAGPPTQADAEALHKALTALYAVHHELSAKGATKGRIHADAEVRIAIQELVAAQKLVKPAATSAPATATATATAPATAAKPTSSFTTKPGTATSSFTTKPAR